MKLLCYSLNNFAPKIVAASAQREWMDAFPDRHAYRCLPLSIANAHGWEVLCPVPIEIEWNGGPAVDDLTVRALKPLPGGNQDRGILPVELLARHRYVSSRLLVPHRAGMGFACDGAVQPPKG